MNWKRGLTRVYVVVWVLFAAAGLLVVWSRWGDVDYERETVNTFLAAHPGVKLEWLQRMKTDSGPYSAESLTIRFAPDVTVTTSGSEFRSVARAAQSDNFIRPASKHMEAVGYWLLFCGLAPAIILLVARWIAAGFAKN